jgi:ribonucleoside-diphosphate reductase alpha chain
LGSITEKLSDDQASITRLVSTALRHGTDIKFIVEQLDKTKGDLTSFSKAIARVLSVYGKPRKKEGLMCENCNSPNLVMEGGCSSCSQCGNSKCS